MHGLTHNCLPYSTSLVYLIVAWIRSIKIQNMSLICIAEDITSSLVIQVSCYKVGPLGKEMKLVVWHLSWAVTVYGVTQTHTLRQYTVNEPNFDWHVTFHLGKIVAQGKSKQTPHTQCHNQGTLQKQTDRSGKLCCGTIDWNSKSSTVYLIPFNHSFYRVSSENKVM